MASKTRSDAFKVMPFKMHPEDQGSPEARVAYAGLRRASGDHLTYGGSKLADPAGSGTGRCWNLWVQDQGISQAKSTPLHIVLNDILPLLLEVQCCHHG